MHSSEEGERRATAADSSLLAAAQELLCVVGVDGCLQWVNDAWRRDLGLDLDALPGSSLLDLVHPDDAERLGLR